MKQKNMLKTFELIDHCLEEEENPCLYIGGEEDNK
jgi:hypothetical protein